MKNWQRSLIKKIIQKPNCNICIEDLLDTIWMSRFFQDEEFEVEDGVGDEIERKSLHPTLEGEKITPHKKPWSKRGDDNLIKGEETDVKSTEMYGSIHLAYSKGKRISGKRIKLPSAPVLSNTLALSRALRPFMQRVPSGTRFSIDEEMTAYRIADEEIWTPFLIPTRERWFNVELVIDVAPSMDIWHEAGDEFLDILEWIGAFGNVRVWSLVTNEKDPQLYAGFTKSKNELRNRQPEKLIGTGRWNLILLLTDCVSISWHDGGMNKMLHQWGTKGHVAIIHVLPDYMWSQTALYSSNPVHLSALKTDPHNFNIRFEYPDSHPITGETKSENTGMPVPVMPFDSRSIYDWARLVTGFKSVNVLGYILRKETNISKEVRPKFAYELEPDESLERFRLVASPTAIRLAQLLSACPFISLNYIRLIRKTFIPGATNLHEAEVFLAGLLKKVEIEDKEESKSDDLNFEFRENIREKLLDSLAYEDYFKVLGLDKVSSDLEKRFGRTQRNFIAILKTQKKGGESFIASDPVARVTAKILSRLGDDYISLFQFNDVKKPSKKDKLIEPFVKKEKGKEKNERKRKKEKTPSKGLLKSLLDRLKARRKSKLIKLRHIEAELEFKNQQIDLFKDVKRKKIAELEAEKEFKDQQQFKAARTAEEMYCAALKEELSVLQLPGSPDIECRAVPLQDAFVSLSISENWRSDQRFADREEISEHQFERHLSPEQAMKRAFQNYHLLLVIGDPGSGKTTLLKYYAVNCLDKIYQKYRSLGFSKPILPIYFPLRELEFANEKSENEQPAALAENLSKWCERHHLDISKDHFNYWLRHRHTLVLLDGLDEISITNQRQKVCKWIKRMCTGLGNARFVVTSRATGYRKLDGIELEVPHLRADIMDFSPGQQEEFLKKWFRTVCRTQLSPIDVDMPEQKWRELQEKRAQQQSQTIIEFLKKEENKSVRELAAVPMLLQIMAILWKERQYLPQTRTGLYDVALDYLLDYRDRQKGIEPLLPADDSRRVLSPTALWMQEELKKDEAPKQTMHQHMQIHLDTLKKDRQYPAEVFCQYLRDRTGVIADYDKDHYIFRHKSFREFLSGMQLKEEAHEDKRLISLINHFKEDWWEESLRFFISKSNPVIFDRLMRLFFQSPVSEQLDAHQQTLLQHLVREAPQKKIDALLECLNSDLMNNNQKRYIIDCLKTIGTPSALNAVKAFSKKGKADKTTLDYARDIVAELTVKETPKITEMAEKDLFTQFPASFRNPIEYNVEYIKIPGGTYKFSATKKIVTVPDVYFCKYPVTNKRYRRFISYLSGEEQDLLNAFPLDMFSKLLQKFSESTIGFEKYLDKNPVEWKGRLKSRLDNDKRFNGDDNPVVGITFYEARTYCFWLSCLEMALNSDKKIGFKDIGTLADIYRLPTEEEWEWAAGGEPDGSIRNYPWPKEKGEPNSNLANSYGNADSTTPVSRYPEGATPHGLVDMAGNVWEWMNNYYDANEERFALRGGSWHNESPFLRCSARNNVAPNDWGSSFGFRVLRTQALFPILSR